MRLVKACRDMGEGVSVFAGHEYGHELYDLLPVIRVFLGFVIIILIIEL
jgi:hypothetical protein